MFCSITFYDILLLQLQLFSWMQENNKLDALSYSHYIRFMASHNLDAAKMLQLYHSIQNQSAKINVLVCNSVLSCLIKKAKFNSALNLFQQMKLDGLLPDLVTYTTVMSFLVLQHTFLKFVKISCLLVFVQLHTLLFCLWFFLSRNIIRCVIL